MLISTIIYFQHSWYTYITSFSLVYYFDDLLTDESPENGIRADDPKKLGKVKRFLEHLPEEGNIDASTASRSALFPPVPKENKTCSNKYPTWAAEKFFDEVNFKERVNNI